MADKREIEVRGPTVDQAIEKGLRQLGLSRRDVLIEVIDEGSRGLLGLGSRDAVVRLKPLALSASDLPISEEIVQEVERESSDWQEERSEAPPKVEKELTTDDADAPAEKVPTADAADSLVKKEEAPDEEPEAAPAAEPAAEPPAADDEALDEESQEERELALEIARTLIDKMNVDASVTAKLSEPDDLTGRRIHVIDIRGDDLGVLIGPRGDTLSDLQYIMRLMVGHKLRRRTNFVVDVAGYRERREQALIRLAERMAKKAADRDRPVGLEPMPSYERRVIHMTLRNRDDVYTQSVGEGKKRKVRIYPKK